MRGFGSRRREKNEIGVTSGSRKARNAQKSDCNITCIFERVVLLYLAVIGVPGFVYELSCSMFSWEGEWFGRNDWMGFERKKMGF